MNLGGLIDKATHLAEGAIDKIRIGKSADEDKHGNTSDDPVPEFRVRLSVRELEKPENEKKRNAFLRAWKLIQELPPANPNSFYAIATYHGEPFKKRQKPVDPKKVPIWGGYCQHQNVLFPTWHRFYVLRLEEALRTVCPDEKDLAMAYWDETSNDTLVYGIPKLLTDDKVMIDGKEEDNPLKHFVIPVAIEGDKGDRFYEKPANYKTVRYPFSGIESPVVAKDQAKIHNVEMEHLFPPVHKPGDNRPGAVAALNMNLNQWLNQGQPRSHKKLNSVHGHYVECLKATTYNTFSNTESAAEDYQISLESPHNDIHLAVGGFAAPGTKGKNDIGLMKGANGDMGENETAAFDPIFFFHHCNVDRVFWIWQKMHGMTKNLDIDPNDKKGTNPEKGQGLTPTQNPGDQLSMDSPLPPFQNAVGVPVTSKDCVNIERQLGYTYSRGSLEDKSEIDWDIGNNPLLRVSDIDRNRFRGSFMVAVYFKTVDAAHFIGERSVFSRWNREDCKNCQYHETTSALFFLPDFASDPTPKPKDFIVEIIARDPINAGYQIVDVTKDVTMDIKILDQ